MLRHGGSAVIKVRQGAELAGFVKGSELAFKHVSVGTDSDECIFELFTAEPRFQEAVG